MMLNLLQCPEQWPQQRIILPQMSEVEKPDTQRGPANRKVRNALPQPCDGPREERHSSFREPQTHDYCEQIGALRIW